MKFNAMVKKVDNQGRITIPQNLLDGFNKSNPIKVMIKNNHIIFTQNTKKNDKIVNFFMPYNNGTVQHVISQYYDKMPEQVVIFKKKNNIIISSI